MPSSAEAGRDEGGVGRVLEKDEVGVRSRESQAVAVGEAFLVDDRHARGGHTDGLVGEDISGTFADAHVEGGRARAEEVQNVLRRGDLGVLPAAVHDLALERLE